MSLLDTASLLLTPNAYKEGKLYSVIPSDGSGDLSVTRATTATRVNSAGLVELVPYNLLTYSEQFNNAAWTKVGGATISANTIIAPNGTLTADTLTIPSPSVKTYIVQNITSAVQCSASIYLKKITGSTATKVRISFNNQVAWNTGESIVVDLTDNWQRVEIPECLLTLATGVRFFIGNLTASDTIDTSITGGDIAIWGAQLVEGTEAKDYYPTETRLNIPRLDYSLGSCPSILVEPQRTNLLLQSSSFDNVYWTKTNGVLTANNTTSPEGTLTADLFTETTFTNSSASVSNSSLISVTSGVAYTTTIYAKKGNDKYLYLSNYYNSANRYYTLIVDLESGTITKEQAGSLITSFSSSITSVGDGWYRISLTQTTASTQLYFILRISNSATPTIDTSYGFITIPSNNNRSLYIWGAQLEAGAYATSYIPTTSASVTRIYDNIQGTLPISLGFEGTAFIDFEDIVQGGIGFGFYNNSNQIAYGFYFYSGGIDVYNGTAFITNRTILFPSKSKIAISFQSGQVKVFINGVNKTKAGATPSSFSVDKLIFNASSGYCYINSVATWTTPLTDDQLEALTTI